MAHMLSAAEAKSNRIGLYSRAEPAAGTKIRALYDMFKNSPGEVVVYAADSNGTSRMVTLRDSYGLDIRNVGYRRWVLAGEWFGDRYVDYVARKICQSLR